MDYRLSSTCVFCNLCGVKVYRLHPIFHEEFFAWILMCAGEKGSEQRRLISQSFGLKETSDPFIFLIKPIVPCFFSSMAGKGIHSYGHQLSSSLCSRLAFCENRAFIALHILEEHWLQQTSCVFHIQDKMASLTPRHYLNLANASFLCRCVYEEVLWLPSLLFSYWAM